MTPEMQAEFEDRFRREQEAQRVSLMSHQTGGNAGGKDVIPIGSPEFEAGRDMPEWAQRSLQYGKSLTTGTLPKVLSAIGTPRTSEMVSGATEQFKRDHPIETTVANLVGSLPTAEFGPIIGGLIRAIPAVGRVAMSIPARMGTAAMTGGALGGMSAVGESKATKMSDLLKDLALGLGSGAVLGGGMSGGGAALGAVGRGVGSRMSQGMAASDAQRELIKALSRDASFDAAGTGIVPGANAARLSALGPEGRVVDVGGRSTQRLADVLTTLPGRASNAFERAIEERQAGRAGRITTAAEESLGTQGKEYGSTLAELEARKISESKPFYDQLKDVTVQADDSLLGLLRRAGKESLGKAQRLSRLAGEDQVSVGAALREARDSVTNAATPGKPISFQSLDHVKQALYDLESKFKIAGEAQEAAGFAKLRRELTAKLDDLSPKDPDGRSIYGQARDAYAGPSQLRDAVESGRKSLKDDIMDLRETMMGMGQSELEAYRVGAMQALRDKAGTEAGQTSLLKMWKEPATSDKLKLIFGGNFSRFEEAIANERSLKAMERIGRGSQTAERQAGMGDLGVDTAMAAGGALADAKTGNIAGAMSGLGKFMRGVSMPENTRNQLAELLLARGGSGQRELELLDQVLASMTKSQARRAAGAGALGSAGAGKFRE
jgi:hypothetical protein